jgi:hypothetical protein
MWAKQSTAATLIVGPILDSAGAEYTSAVIGDLSLSKNGGTLTALASAATLTHIANGQYTLVMTTGNVDTLGRAQITCNKSTYQMPAVNLMVVPAMVFDSLVLGTDVLQSDTTQFGGTAITAAAGIPEVKVASIASNAVNASALASDAVTEIQSGLATQASVDDLPTNAELATALGTADDAVLAAIATVQSDTNDIQTRLPAALEGGRIAAVLDSAARVKLHGTQDDYAPLKSSDYTAPLTAAATRTALGMSAADLDTQLDAILAAASAGAGTGARLVTITVNDGTTVLQNAVVRLTEGGNTYRALTNVSGVATFNVDDATYSVAISKVGYSYAGTTIVVNGVEIATYSMTAINVTPGSGDLTTGYLTCLDELGAAEANVAVRCQLVQVPTSGTGYAYDSTVQIDTSAANGLVEFPMIKGARYLVWRGSIKPPEGIAPILISASAGSTTALGSLIGP